MKKNLKPHLYPQVYQPLSYTSYLFKFVDLPDKEISIAPGDLGVCNMDHVLREKAVRREVAGGKAGAEKRAT